MLTSNSFLIKLFRSKAGLEKKLTNDLGEENPEAVYFKVLGKFDILEISKLNDLYEACRGNTNIEIMDMMSFPCFCDSEMNEKFWLKISDATVSSLTLVKLHESIFRRRGLSGENIVSDYLKTMDSELFPLRGIGYHEIFLWHASDNLENIFNILKKLGALKIGKVIPSFSKKHRHENLIVEFNTIPLVSYKNIITQENWGPLEGKVRPLVKIKCQPGKELEASQGWPVGIYQILGVDDIACVWPEPTDLGEFIRLLLNRRKHGAESFSILNTTTRLMSLNPIDIQPPIEMTPFDEKSLWRTIWHRLGELIKLPDINHFLISEITNIISLINIHTGSRIPLATYSDIIYSLKYLDKLLVEYKDATVKKNFPIKAEKGSDVLFFADYLRIALTQRLGGISYDESSIRGIRPTFVGSLSRILRALSLIPEQLFQIISTSAPPSIFKRKCESKKYDNLTSKDLKEFSFPWKGFLVLDVYEGYQKLEICEIFLAPYGDIFRPLNWVTLSHEMAHAYYDRIKFELVEDEYLKYCYKQYRKDSDEFATTFSYTCEEVFAHWFDFRHFFNGEIDFYLWSIWKTWFDIPRIYQFRTEYWVRSAMIKICNEWSRLSPKFEKLSKKTSEWLEGIKEIFRVEYNYVQQLLKIKFPDKYKAIMLNSKEEEELFELLSSVFHLVKRFEEFYINPSILREVNKSYPRLDKDIDRILSGESIKIRIPNPLLLLREILRKSYDGKIDYHLSDQSSIALIDSFWDTSRYYHRE